jgi:hypothetical protein
MPARAVQHKTRSITCRSKGYSSGVYDMTVLMIISAVSAALHRRASCRCEWIGISLLVWRTLFVVVVVGLVILHIGGVVVILVA